LLGAGLSLELPRAIDERARFLEREGISYRAEPPSSPSSPRRFGTCGQSRGGSGQAIRTRTRWKT
jgi:hypothetical protein